MAHLLFLLDYAGVAIFAVTGALAAARCRHDVLTFIAFAIMTGLGGGSIRDMLIGVPVFWIHSASYLWVCIGAGVAVWAVGERLWSIQALLWLDAIGLAAYAMLGAAKALNFDVSPLVAVVMGTVTATFGGILRDLFAGEASALLRREIYISAAVVAAGIFVMLQRFGLDVRISIFVAFLAGFALRAGAIMWGWSLPGFDSGTREK